MGFIKALTPAIVGLSRRAPGTARLAYNALAMGVKGGKKVSAATGVATKALKGAGKYLPIAGAAATAYGAYAGYNDAIAQGQDPGRAAFKGIGGVAGGALGVLGGSALGGPVGGLAGYAGGGYVGEKLAGRAYDMIGGQDQPAPPPMSVQEQRAYRQQMRQQGRGRNQPQGNYQDIAGFRYSEGADSGLVGLRVQQQAQNINAMGGYSTTKHLSNNQLRGTLGQQAADRYMYGQMGQTDRYRSMQDNQTERYRVGRGADVENTRTRGTVTLGLGEQYTQRFVEGRKADTERAVQSGDQYTRRFLGGKQYDTERAVQLGNQYTQRFVEGRKADMQQRLGLGGLANERYGLETTRQIGGRELDIKRYDIEQGYGLKERERKDKRYGVDVEAGLRRQQMSNAYDTDMFGAIAGMYR